MLVWEGLWAVKLAATVEVIKVLLIACSLALTSCRPPVPRRRLAAGLRRCWWLFPTGHSWWERCL